MYTKNFYGGNGIVGAQVRFLANCQIGNGIVEAQVMFPAYWSIIGVLVSLEHR
jgi:hypothetical protein